MKKILIFFLFGFFFYMSLEVIATGLDHTIKKQFIVQTPYASLIGFSTIWMGIAGGIIFILLGWMNKLFFTRKISLFALCLIGSCIITTLEFTSGCVLNLWLKFGIWNYGGINLLGQIDLIHSAIWFIITPAVIWLDNLLDFLFYKEGSPVSILWVYLHLFIPILSIDYKLYVSYSSNRVGSFKMNFISSFIDYGKSIRFFKWQEENNGISKNQNP